MKLKDIIIEKNCHLASCNKLFLTNSTKKGKNRKYCSNICARIGNGRNNKGRHHTPETRKKISDAMSGEKNSFYGRKHTEEVKRRIGKINSGTYEERFGEEKSKEIKAKLSDALSGQNNPFYGKKLTKEHIEKRTNTVVNRGSYKGENNPMYGKGYLISGEKNGAWQGGSSFGEYGLEFTDELRTEIRKRDNFTCQVCNSNGYTVHHIDYIKHHNNKKNLITTCTSCHGKTGFNRDSWISFFKTRIQEIYGNTE